MKKKLIQTEVEVKGKIVRIIKIYGYEYISLTDLAKYSNPESPANVIIH